MSTRSLIAFSLGLLGFLSIKVLAPAFYARHDMRTPVRVGIIALVSNMVMAVVLVFVFPLAHAGLALATSLSAFLNSALLYRALRKQGAYQPQHGWKGMLLRLLAANTLMAGVLWLGAGKLSPWLEWTAATRAWHLLAIIVAGALAYFVALWICGLRWRELLIKPTGE